MIVADLYIAHYVAALPAAARAAKSHGARFAFDAEDFHIGDTPEVPSAALEKRLIRSIESRYLPRCTYITAASPGIADAYCAEYGIRRPTVILNVLPLAQAPRAPTLRGVVAPGPSIYWFSQTIGPDRGLETALRAVAAAKTKPHLYLRGTLAAGYLQSLEELASNLEIADRLHVLGPEAPAEMAHLASRHDVGLVGETGKTRNHQIALANKPFAYLLGGVPAVMSDIPAHRDFAAELGSAGRLYRVEDPVSLASAIDGILGHPANLATARAVAFECAQNRFNWETEGATFVACVEEAVGR